MYKIIATQLSQISTFPYSDFLKSCIIYARSDIETKMSKTRNVTRYDFISQPQYPGETFFVGFGNWAKWISLNIIENSDKLFLHTTLNPIQPCNLIDVSQNFAKQGFMTNRGNAKLYEVGLLNNTEQTLINAVNQILQQLK